MEVRLSSLPRSPVCRPDPHVLAEEIADDLRSALAQIEDVLGDLQGRAERMSLGTEAPGPGSAG